MTLRKSTRRTFLKVGAAATAATVTGIPLVARAQPRKIRIATLAPDGSSWVESFQKVAREINQRTSGDVAIQVYPGGFVGDEPAMVRKMRSGQLEGAALTGVGLGEIHQQLRMLELPLLFRDYAELEQVRNAMSERFESFLVDNHFVLQSWGDVGFTYVFSTKPLRSPEELRRTRAWVREADSITRALLEMGGVEAVPLSVPGLQSALKAGTVDAFFCPPYAARQMQWHVGVSHMTRLRFSAAVGGVVLTASAWDSLSAEHQAIWREAADREARALNQRVREANTSAIATLREEGIEVVEPEDLAAWQALADKVRAKLTRELLDAELVEAMLSHRRR